jgi:hypothetical protein
LGAQFATELARATRLVAAAGHFVRPDIVNGKLPKTRELSIQLTIHLGK